MSEKHLYETHLAEKLQQISPLPDAEGNWQKMKSLLDEDKPRGGGFGKRWWQISVIAGILLIGGWLAGTQYLQTGNEKNPVVAEQPNPASVEVKKSSPDKIVPGSDTKPVSNGKASALDRRSPADGGLDRRSPSEGGPDAAKSNAAPSNGTAKEEPLVVVNNNNKPSETSSSIIENNNRGTAKTVIKKPTGKDRRPAIVNADVGNDGDITRNNPDRKTNNKNTNKTDDLNLLSNNTVKKELEYSTVDENTNYITTAPAPGDNLKTDFSLLSLSTKSVLKSKSSRAGRNRQDRSFSFGFSLPLAFPLGDQKALSYNFNGGANTVSDYIPSPHVQYKLNNKTYLQTELQFISPQYIRPILLYETRVSQAGSYMLYNSIYARKLYYFNLPVGIHHSPFPNFFLGTGLQFSSLLSGVGLYEQTKRSMSGQPISLISEHYGKMSNDSLNYRMNTAEVRLMLEMNYYFNRFTFGLRYNQAFNNYVNFRLDNMSPYTFDKNKALQFYLRYNLWEDLRRRPNAKGSLSSK